ncbi:MULTISPECIES: flagellar hook-basal body complex protein [Sulfurimonas]|uniref:flagellar hook protein FlgE n=1 Tax=Sulfurimonas TaxID=202746 RepID=UPI00126418F3|nr:flagellar hook-basal body complex protein [Sulfurimonas indica]
MMTQAFYTGISGLKVYSNGIDVVSDNLANISTPGFRAYNAEYSALFEDSLASASSNLFQSNSVGVGVQMQTTSMSLDQGSLTLSDRSTDLAIMGDGWFGIQQDGAPLYTRAGDFTFDANDDLVTNDGYYVLGTMGGNISADNILTQTLAEVPLGDINAQEKLRFPKTLTYPPEPTTEAKFIANLGVGKEGYEVITVGASVIDRQNERNELKLTFTRSAVQTPPGTQWDVVATVKSLDGQTTYDTQTGQVAFDESGALVSSSLTTIDNNGTPVAIDLGSGYDGIVSIDIPVVSGSSVADGTIGGDLRGYSINKNGEVIATFTNGRQSSVGRIAVFHFQNDQGLERITGTRFAESSNSGQALFFKDATGQNIIGTEITNFKLEGSNVEMSAGLTELIILQRAYDANSKSVTTADEMIQKALNMDA